MSREESPRLGLARTGELIAELGMRFRIAEHEAKRARELLEDGKLAKRLAEGSCDRQYGDYVQARESVRYYRAALLAELEGRE